jgi:hypothetical protein
LVWFDFVRLIFVLVSLVCWGIFLGNVVGLVCWGIFLGNVVGCAAGDGESEK